MRLFVFLLFALAAADAEAQDWATRAFCDVSLSYFDARDVAPYDMAALDTAAAKISNGTGRFWRIEGPDGAVSHLWGTMHVSHPDILDVPEDVIATIQSARVAAFEIDFTYPDRDAIFAEYDLPGRYRTGGDPFAASGTLDLSYLGQAEPWVLDRLEALGTFEDALYVLTPGGLAELLLSDPCEDFTSGVIPTQDDYLHTLAHIAGVRVMGLEQSGDLIHDLANDPETALAVVMVYASYLEPQKSNALRTAIFELYREGRLAHLAALDALHLDRLFGPTGQKALDQTDRYLLDLRNQRFVAAAVKELNQGGLFMAVGAGHLPGKGGLVALLRENGFTVTRVHVEGERQ